MREAARRSSQKSKEILRPSSAKASAAAVPPEKTSRGKKRKLDDVKTKVKQEAPEDDEPSTTTADSKALRGVGKSRTRKDSKVKSESVSPKKIKREDAGNQDDEVATALTTTLPQLADKYARSAEKGTLPADIKMQDPASHLATRKLKSFADTATDSPFPDFAHPTEEETELAHTILTKLHGARTRPQKVVASKDRAGCGDSPAVLDALVRTILSQNTSDTNSTRAKRSMDAVYGGSDKWEAIVEGGVGKLEDAIRCGGLSQVKSKVIMSILEQVMDKYGEYSLDHLKEASDEEAMREMLAFKGVGPKTASCVCLFSLARDNFAVDTHVHRITGLLGWRPQRANREQTYAHLDKKIPDRLKYPLHILIIDHGKKCDECKAGGRNAGKCELRKAFRKAQKGEIKVEGMDGAELKEEVAASDSE